MVKSKTFRVIESSPKLQRRKIYFFQILYGKKQKGVFSRIKAKKLLGYLTQEAGQESGVKLTIKDKKKGREELLKEFEGSLN